MTPLNLVQRLLESTYHHACLMIQAPPEIGDITTRWGELNIPDEHLHTTPDGDMGREYEPHVTVKYGMTVNEVPPEVYAIAHSTSPFPVYVGKVSLFRNPEFDVVKCDVESPVLRRLHAKISAMVPNEDSHPDYRPHLTIAYVKKGTCDQLEGMDVFEDHLNREFTAPGMIWKGAGADEDQERVQEVLLFSKVKQQSMAMAESEVDPQYYVDTIGERYVAVWTDRHRIKRWWAKNQFGHGHYWALDPEHAVKFNLRSEAKGALDWIVGGGKGAVEVMAEAVVGPTPAQMQEIARILEQSREECNGDAIIFRRLANHELRHYKIFFEIHPEMKRTGSPGYGDHTGVYLVPPTAVQLQDRGLMNHYLKIIQHELVHVEQTDRMPPNKRQEVVDRTTAWMTPRGYVDQDRYLQQKQEVMAWASSLVDGWVNRGLDREQMLKRLQSGNWGFAEKYWYSRKQFPKTFNKFMRYAMDYIDRHFEVKESEVDPQHYIDQLKPSKYLVFSPEINAYVSKDGEWTDEPEDAARWDNYEEAKRYATVCNPSKPCEVVAVRESDEVDPQHYIDGLKPMAWTYKMQRETVGDSDYWQAWYCYYGEPQVYTERQDKLVVEQIAEAWTKKFNALEKARPYHTESHAYSVWEWQRRYADMVESGLEPPRPEKAHFDNADKPDPFDDLPFPSNSDDMSRFLRRRRKKRPERPIL